MSRVPENPIKKLARAILALTIEQRNALDVALEIHEEAVRGSAPKAPRPLPVVRRKPAPQPAQKPAPEVQSV